jgi:hypothetical protein
MEASRKIYDLGVRNNEPLYWRNFDIFPMVRIFTIGDGSCLLHAVANSFYIPYRTESFNGVGIRRSELIRDLRKELSTKLSLPSDPLYPNGPLNYDLLAGGVLSTMLGKENPEEFGLKAMMERLADPSKEITFEYMEFISNQLNKDIYFLDSKSQDVYLTEIDDSYLYKGRESVVLLYIEGITIGGITGMGHFELIGLRTNEGIATYFRPDHEFISYIQNRIRIKTTSKKSASDPNIRDITL